MSAEENKGIVRREIEEVFSKGNKEERINRNGIDLDMLRETVEGIRHHPEAGTVTVCTRHRWDGGFAVDGRAETVEQAGEVETRTHTFRTDWPKPWGSDSGPTPGAESFMATLGACVATTYIAKATLQGVAIDELEVTVEGRVDLQGLFEIGSACPRFSEIAVTVDVRSDADDAVLDSLGQTTSCTSPVYDSLANPVPLQLRVRRLS